MPGDCFSIPKGHPLTFYDPAPSLGVEVPGTQTSSGIICHSLKRDSPSSGENQRRAVGFRELSRECSFQWGSVIPASPAGLVAVTVHILLFFTV